MLVTSILCFRLCFYLLKKNALLILSSENAFHSDKAKILLSSKGLAIIGKKSVSTIVSKINASYTIQKEDTVIFFDDFSAFSLKCTGTYLRKSNRQMEIKIFISGWGMGDGLLAKLTAIF